MKEKLSHLFDNKQFYLVLSVMVAVLYWLVLSMADDSDVERTIYDVPVQLDYNASVYQNFGLEIIGAEPVLVDVVVTGPRTELDGLSADDFLIYPNVNAVTNAGNKKLRLVYGTVNSNVKYSIARLSQDTVDLRFDQVVSKKFTVQLDTGISVKEGYLLNSCVANPSEITVTGPSTELSVIDRVRVTMPDLQYTGALDESLTTRGRIFLLDENGATVRDEEKLLQMDSNQVEVYIDILRRIEQPLKVQFTNVPRGFDPTTLGVTLDRETVPMAVPASYDPEVDGENYPLYINFYDLQTRSSYQEDYVLSLSAPEGCQLLDNIQQVTVSFATQDYVQMPVQVTDIRVVGVPEGKQVTSVTEVLNNVILVGPQAAIDKLVALEEQEVLQEYIIAQADASKINIQSGQAFVPVQILIPSIGNVFAIGSYTVVASVE